MSALTWDTVARGSVWLTIAHYSRDGRYIISRRDGGGYLLTRAKLNNEPVLVGRFVSEEDARLWAEAEHREGAK